MTHSPRSRGLARFAPHFLPGLLVTPVVVPVLVPILLGGPQHVAEGEGARVTALWRSEKALDQYAQEGLRIVQGVMAAVRAESREEEALASASDPVSVLSLGLAESPLDLRWLEHPELKADDVKRRRRRRRAGLDDDDDGGEGGSEGPGQPLVVPSIPGLDSVGAVVAVAPRIHDRVMFGTGLPPSTRAALALEAARALLAGEGEVPADFLGPAIAGLNAAKFGRTLEQEPFASSALADLQNELRGLPEEGGVRAEHLKSRGSEVFPKERFFDPYAPSVAPTSLVARHAAATGMSVNDVLALRPAWVMEAGAVGTHPFGWQTVATRRTDALVLSAEPLSGESFTLTTTVVLFANDMEVAAQADLVLGDRQGDRYLLVCNTREGVYVFHRAGPEAPYEAIAEAKEIVPPAGRPIEVKALWKDQTLVITVGGVEMAGIVLPADAMVGGYGFGAHAGSTVMFSEIVLD
ncbi:hypothetical protein Poly30_25930 [Planctomycetes bacterium Poly30]|uniref:Uncharacterized protein n=2 Tax=Saltatorellus ferox TaxID=2528018 RepID=A0A518ESK5_9BACT|nr:hypothetical protein Poly30_25930 [Planctomycetes bacterium Poly30]